MKGDEIMIFDALAGAYFELCNGIAHMAFCRASTASLKTPHKQVRQWQNKHHMTLGHMCTQSQMKDNKAPLVCKHQCLYAESQGPVDTHVNSVKLSGVVHTSTHEQGEFTSHPSPRSTTALALCC